MKSSKGEIKMYVYLQNHSCNRDKSKKYLTEVETNTGTAYYYTQDDQFLINTLNEDLEEVRVKPTYKMVVPKFIGYYGLYKNNNNTLKENNYAISTTTPEKDGKLIDVNFEYTLNRELGWLSGVCATTFWVPKKFINDGDRVSFNITTKNEILLEKIKQYIKNIDGNSVTFEYIDNKILSVHNAPKVRSFISTKHIDNTSNILDLCVTNDSTSTPPLEFLYGYISGILDIDGIIYSNTNNNKFPVCKLYSINYNFLAAFKLLCINCGIDCNIKFVKKTNTGNLKYFLFFSKSGVKELQNNIILEHREKQTELNNIRIGKIITENRYYSPELSVDRFEELIEHLTYALKNCTKDSDIKKIETLITIVDNCKKENKVLTLATCNKIIPCLSNDSVFTTSKFWSTWINYVTCSGFVFEMVTRIKKYYI
jgi:hypothetical protein